MHPRVLGQSAEPALLLLPTLGDDVVLQGLGFPLCFQGVGRG